MIYKRYSALRPRSGLRTCCNYRVRTHNLARNGGFYARDNQFQHVALASTRPAGARLFPQRSGVSQHGSFGPGLAVQPSGSFTRANAMGARLLRECWMNLSIYNRALSASEIQSIYAADGTGKWCSNHANKSSAAADCFATARPNRVRRAKRELHGGCKRQTTPALSVVLQLQPTQLRAGPMRRFLSRLSIALMQACIRCASRMPVVQ